jgi:SAM-dependent methyltransferase
VYEVGISYAGRTYEQGKKIGWRDGMRALYCVVNYSPIAARTRARMAQRRTPFSYDEADDTLAEVLTSIDDANEYADWIADLLAPHVCGDILEIGSGHGVLTQRLANLGNVTATDPSSRAVEQLRARFDGYPNVEVLEADAESAPNGHTFDTIVMVNVLEHIPDELGALKTLRDALRSGGRLLVYVPAFNLLYSQFDRELGHQRRYRRKTLTLACKRAGLDVIDTRYVNSAGFVAWLVYARGLRQVPTRAWSTNFYDRRIVPRLRRIEEGREVPVGQSVLCVATRPSY